jgi:pimeloyl-ACP methyl ester carboxylesterase
MIEAWSENIRGLQLAGLQHAGQNTGQHTDADSGARPSLLLHGWLDNAASMAPLFPACAGPALALDLPGHGHSAHTNKDHHAPFLDYVDAVLGVLEAQNWPQVNLIGHSMGGAIALLFAASFPERVAKLVLLDVLGPVSSEPENFPAELRKGLLARRRVSSKPLPGKASPIYPSVEAALDAREGNFGISREAAHGIVERGLVTSPDGGFCWRTDPRLMTPSPMRMTEPQVHAAISALQAATLIVLAEPRTSFLADAKSQARMQAFEQKGDSVRITAVPGSHHVHLDQTPSVIALIAAHLQQS